jgi:dTDP-4-amino-4,6-dideoxygalactose transaminase
MSERLAHAVPEHELRGDPHRVTRDFERALCRYTGAPYAVAVNSCTAALLLACRRQVMIGGPHALQPDFEIPRRTYVSVPQSIIHAGGRVAWRDEEWRGYYRVKPYFIWDSARWFTTGLYPAITLPYGGGAVCVSFHASKTLGIEQGGAILHDDGAADDWYRRARFDGRREGVAPADDDFDFVGYHVYINPSTAAQALLRLYSLARENAPLANDEYPDLSRFKVFR